MSQEKPTHPPADSAPRRADRPPSLRGPWVVVATMSLFIVVPVISFGAIKLIQRDLAQYTDAPLVWAQRTAWPAMEMRAKSLERGPMASSRTGEKYKDYGFHLDAPLMASIARCRELATATNFLTDTTAVQLQTETDDHPQQFYAPALLALWHEQHQHDAQAQAAWSLAFQRAPAALIQNITTPDGPPAPRLDVGTVAFAFDQVNDDQLDSSLTLIYPRVTTDAQGTWRLPIFKMLLRLIDPPLAPAVGNDPAVTIWFTHVGPVGQLPSLTAPH